MLHIKGIYGDMLRASTENFVYRMQLLLEHQNDNH